MGGRKQGSHDRVAGRRPDIEGEGKSYRTKERCLAKLISQMDENGHSRIVQSILLASFCVRFAVHCACTV